jgi:hypothetical protein
MPQCILTQHNNKKKGEKKEVTSTAWFIYEKNDKWALL